MKKKNEELTFKDIISVFIPKIWLILIVAIVFGAVMGVYSVVFKGDTYTASYKSCTFFFLNSIILSYSFCIF